MLLMFKMWTVNRMWIWWHNLNCKSIWRQNIFVIKAKIYQQVYMCKCRTGEFVVKIAKINGIPYSNIINHFWVYNVKYLFMSYFGLHKSTWKLWCTWHIYLSWPRVDPWIFFFFFKKMFCCCLLFKYVILLPKIVDFWGKVVTSNNRSFNFCWPYNYIL